MSELPWDDSDLDVEGEDFTLCPVCGAYSSRSCEMLEEGGGECPWELMREEDEGLAASRADDLRDMRRSA